MKKCEATMADLLIDGEGYKMESLKEYRELLKLAGMSGIKIMRSAKDKALAWQEKDKRGRRKEGVA